MSFEVRISGSGVKPYLDAGELAPCELVIARLEEAGETLLSLPGPSFGSGSSWPQIVHDFADLVEQYAAQSQRRGVATVRPPVPSAAAISRMDEAFGWLGLIPSDRYVLRRIVSTRALVSPSTGRHEFSWRDIGRIIGAHHMAVQRWHKVGIDLIVAGLGWEK